ncbi:hypothetical protein Pmar_PMAR003249 [Perkinsus marinus ATCC 50983]|uniref:Uncharacterized protein n=1 Tax=Perkinsus marinus (strain ATCC 50983 / TXsc) TaxID=423536 RepID=C5LM05_PERM5|nr:hypothetical protein Pmar_PMAR003249 [Perkinsus marinus ATCC 50983]EER02238.1 hypothetical protein Pmar_PMAR003249 [Perkinsus marinus ATCC 50983]|eukprot:XP_002769520.1 hypothetical protein Pmar_PMAR003249 [Perkinsus marinus ATCC 50983]
MVVKECAKDVCTGKIIASGANASIEIRQVETVVSKSPGRNLEVVLPSVHNLPVGAVVSLKSRHARQGKASVISKSMDGLQEYLVPLNSVCEFADNST